MFSRRRFRWPPHERGDARKQVDFGTAWTGRVWNEAIFCGERREAGSHLRRGANNLAIGYEIGAVDKARGAYEKALQ